MKTQLFGLSKAAAAVRILGAGLLFLISCNNFLAPPQEGGLEGNGDTGTVLLSFGNGVEGARTLLPGGVSFALYRLTMTPVAPAGSPIQHDISSAPSGTITLAAGTWNIHVDAYTDAEGTNKAAEGNSGTITVSAHAVKQVNITLSPITGGGTGTLSVAITDGGGGIKEGELYIFNGPDFNIPVSFNGGSDVKTFGPGGLTMTIPLSSGQYRVAVGISNNSGQWYIINEVAYICGGLTTGLTRSITSNDFTGGAEMTVISGTVEYSDSGVDQSGYVLRVFGGSEEILGGLAEVSIDAEGPQSYTLNVPRPGNATTLYFEIEKDGYSTPAGDLSLLPGQTTAMKDISLNVIPLSGSVAVTIGGSSPAPGSVTVYAYSIGEGRSLSSYGIVTGSAWTLKVPSDTVHLNFRVSVQDGLQADSFSALSWIWTSGSATTGIALNGSFVLVKGSFTATGNGKTVSNVPVVFGASKTSPPDFLIWSSRYVWTGNTCTWTFSTEALSPQASVAFTIVNYDDGSIIGTETAILGTSNITIPLRTYTYTSKVLSGTIGTVTVDGHSVTQFDIYALDPFASSVVGRSTVNGNTWEISGIPGNFSGTLNIMVSAEYSGSYYGTKAGSWTSDTATTGINLGNVNIDGLLGGGGGGGF